MGNPADLLHPTAEQYRERAKLIRYTAEAVKMPCLIGQTPSGAAPPLPRHPPARSIARLLQKLRVFTGRF
jgi:hypothetical protein